MRLQLRRMCADHPVRVVDGKCALALPLKNLDGGNGVPHWKFVRPGERLFVLLSSGSLSCSQSVISLLRRDFDNDKGLAAAATCSAFESKAVTSNPARCSISA